MSFLLTIWGSGHDLDIVQMSARAVVVFLVTLVFIRISGRRSLGQRSPFDMVVAILLGATASRIIVGASPAFPTFAACLGLVLMHRAVGWVDARWPRGGELVSGPSRLLFSEGHFDALQLRLALLSVRDVEHAARQQLGVESLTGVDKAFLERNGSISFVKTGEPSRGPARPAARQDQ